ncbi:hypothetical protein [Paraglaciecola sp. L3A3]|uniref:hypothetical protein n=1 Tax=Paraglaciecola sp. L3A3 TaxID=2686358 RepID=UPI00131C13FB|nr:hypothetical protein [Paraglaciecola sp. L3A3]
MKLLKRKRSNLSAKAQVRYTPIGCRCGGMPTKPERIPGCRDRWLIGCKVKRCYAYNIGQGLADTIQGWNRLSEHLYR